ncbi:MAG: class III signal peptide-containing protein [Candidatus Diapherotrites archaeon]|nr:class III signal peptide-containing protein [Candidatus Diapherotrites archaeon]
MKITTGIKGQGAIEYLLMIAGAVALAIVAITVLQGVL